MLLWRGADPKRKDENGNGCSLPHAHTPAPSAEANQRLRPAPLAERCCSRPLDLGSARRRSVRALR
jgi:hypothetical protein